MRVGGRTVNQLTVGEVALYPAARLFDCLREQKISIPECQSAV